MAAMGSLLRQWWPLLLGNVLEWYEFGVFGALTKQLTVNFFRGSAIGTWSGFGVTFLLRPVGGILFGRLADRVGRKTAVLWSMRGMLLATVAQGLLPSLICCGEASANVGLVLLVLLRALQGICTGGEIGPLVTYMAESSPQGSLGVGTVLFLLSALVAFIISGSFVALLVLMLGPEAMLTWGWRVPFVIVLPPGLLTLWGRSNLPETAEFVKLQRERNSKLDQKASQREVEMKVTPPSTSISGDAGKLDGGAGPASIAESPAGGGADGRHEGASRVGRDASSDAHAVLRDHMCSVAVGFGVSVAGAAAIYTGVWCAPHLAKQGGLDQASALGVSSLMYVVAGISALACAVICDTYFESDPFLIMTVGTGCLAVVGCPVFWGIEAYSGNLLVTILCVSVVFGAAQGAALSQAYNFCICIFPTHLRAVGFGLTFNLAMAYVGGTAALVDQALDGLSPLAPGLYLSLLGLLSLFCSLLALRLRRTGHLRFHALVLSAPTEDPAPASSAAPAVGQAAAPEVAAVVEVV